MNRVAGFSLIEVMVVLGVLSASVLLWAEVARQVDRSMQYPEAQVNLGALSTVVRETLKYQKTCQSALVGGINSTGFGPSQIMGGTPEIQLRIPGILADGTSADDVLGLSIPPTKVQHLEITGLRAINSVSLGANKYFSEIELSAKVDGTGLALRPMIAGGVYYTISGSSLASCDTKSDDPTSLCAEMGCTWDITQTPACQCTPIDLSCPPQQFITGVDNVGKPICTPLGNGPCSAGFYLRGISIGANDCAALP